MDFDAAYTIFLRRAGDEVVAFMAAHGGRRAAREARRRNLVSERELEDAARAILRDVESTRDVEEFAGLDESERLRKVIGEATAQGLEDWWQAVGSRTLRNPDKRRQIWWWIQERLGGHELLPRP